MSRDESRTALEVMKGNCEAVVSVTSGTLSDVVFVSVGSVGCVGVGFVCNSMLISPSLVHAPALLYTLCPVVWHPALSRS